MSETASSPEAASPQTWFCRGVDAARPAELRAAGGATRRARLAQRAADRLVAAAPGAAQRACAAGCAFCCHFPVGVTPAEAHALAEAVAVRFAGAERAALRARIATVVRAEADLDFAALGAQRRPCVLLGSDDRCRVYDARPIACRGWNSASRAVCERDFRGEAVRPALDPAPYFACLGVHAALAAADADAGAAATYELTSALDRALDGGSDLRGCKPV